MRAVARPGAVRGSYVAEHVAPRVEIARQSSLAPAKSTTRQLAGEIGVLRSRKFPIAAVKDRPCAFRLDFVRAFECRAGIDVSRVLYIGKKLHLRGVAGMVTQLSVQSEGN